MKHITHCKSKGIWSLRCFLCVFFVLALAGLTVQIYFVQKEAVATANLFHQTRVGTGECRAGMQPPGYLWVLTAQ